MYRTKIIATGSYVPEKILTNFDLEKMAASPQNQRPPLIWAPRLQKRR
jgi:3-oxoacyl-[acyl-carrier-protein] synthase III